MASGGIFSKAHSTYFIVSATKSSIGTRGPQGEGSNAAWKIVRGAGLLGQSLDTGLCAERCLR